MSFRSSAGPATERMPTPSSSRRMCARLVLPRPGGPTRRTWSSASPLPFAASSAIASCSFTRAWPTNSSSRRGRRLRSSPPRPLRAASGARNGAVLMRPVFRREPDAFLRRQVVVDLGERALGVEERPAELDERVARDDVLVARLGRPARAPDRRACPSARARSARPSSCRRRESPGNGRHPRGRSRGAAPPQASRRRSRARPSGRRR